MTAPILRGPYRLASASIADVVPPRVPGVYVLGAIAPGGLRMIDAIGRADCDLAAALLDLLGSNSGFMFDTAASAPEAFKMECWLYHQHMLIGLRPHPLAPSSSLLKCSVCGSPG